MKKREKIFGVGSFFLILLLFGIPAAAQAGRTWSVRGEEEFSKGEFDGVSVLSSGELILAPPVETFDGLEADIVWDINIDADGRVLVATGAPGALYAIEDDTASLIHRTSEEHALSVLPLPDGSVLLGTAPRGIIYRIAESGEVTVFADLDVNYVWDMARSEDGLVYCATGAGGKILSLTSEGDVTEVFSAPQANLMCLEIDEKRGGIYVGTQPDGIVYEVKKNGDYSILFDAEEDEIRNMVFSEGRKLYVCTAQSKPAMQGEASGDDGAVSVRPADGRDGSQNLLPGKPTASNSIYRIDPDTGAYRVARFREEMVLSIALREDGEIFAGTGDAGRLIGVREDGRTRMILKTGSRHVSALAGAGDGRVLMGASSPGRLYRLGVGYRPEGAYVSHVFDAGYLSGWGAVSLPGADGDTAGTEIYLRTGNSRKPDRTWSDWAGPASGGVPERLDVPMGRFAQVRIKLTSKDGVKTPEVNRFAVSYRQANRRPVVERLEINEGGGGGNANRPGRTITWEVSDPNDDDLKSSLYYRGVDERDWKSLKDGLRDETSYSWDTVRVPDGYYLVKLIASDRPSRGLTEALQDEKVIGPFLIDNTPPRVHEIKAVRRRNSGSYVITGIAADRASNITSIQVSHNSGDWRAVFPDDGIFDSRREPFTFVTPKLDEGEHVFVFIAEDSAGNVGSGKIVIDTVQ